MDLANFSLFNFPNLNNFFNFSDFLMYFISLLPNLLTSPLPLFLSETGLLPLFLLETSLLLLILPKADLLNNLIVFNIEVNRATILLKLIINQ